MGSVYRDKIDLEVEDKIQGRRSAGWDTQISICDHKGRKRGRARI